jgi:hypothetical protein
VPISYKAIPPARAGAAQNPAAMKNAAMISEILHALSFFSPFCLPCSEPIFPFPVRSANYFEPGRKLCRSKGGRRPES